MVACSAVMARVWLAFCQLFFLFTSTPCLDVSQILVPTNDGISGVLLVQAKNNVYSFNATTAREACEAIKMRIANLAEVKTANQNGLQTCRFGWIEEQIAVIPRIERSEKCGRNNSGVIIWRINISRMFDVYCFKPAGPDGSFETTSSRPQPTTGGRTPSNKHYPTKTTHPSSIKSASSPVYTSTPSISFAFNTSSTTFITLSLSNISDSSQATTSPLSLSSSTTSPKFSTSSPSSSSHSSTFLFQHTLTSTGQPALSQTTTPNKTSQHTLTSTGQPALSQTTTPNRASRATPKTFVIISFVLLLLLAAAGAAWYLKIKRRQRFPSWTRMRPKQITETEMWKQISERHCVPEQNSKDNNFRKCNNIILQLEQDPDTP
ncbi:lymphatic vessel endothelial hyaluronic receptor 1b [Ctenopharyngodon idella]|uniref:lymphatic vessel endothelial hyaluronic receptor 1b n=1 Tax=Ctenopharyngodon idella TaxID=7959 RepID=UPI00222E493D|nr:lymphatic vessel endothelial hyaluronic receptor 1b [Ctenopharyngodon idella]XP_051726033.1 lymphatic vessel endothelial hyaluronic receptor 1b [Ctenopharyngodon idella]